MKKSFIELLERHELVQKLINRGYGQLVDVLLNEESYTKKGRPNKSSICRQLRWKPKQLEDALEDCQHILMSDMGWETSEA
jgi:hypothetical protein